jgi:hypothetical protein
MVMPMVATLFSYIGVPFVRAVVAQDNGFHPWCHL